MNKTGCLPKRAARCVGPVKLFTLRFFTSGYEVYRRGSYYKLFAYEVNFLTPTTS